MSLSTLASESGFQESPPIPAAPSPAQSGLPSHVTKNVLSGTSALTLGLVIERGSSFLANIVAARLAGATAFGAYAIAISTANNVSTYAAGGIGSTAARFSGKYAYASSGYRALARALLIVAGVSALLAVAALWLGAAPIAAVLHKPSLTGLLRWAAISTSGIVLLECARGFFVGQRRLAALLFLSCVVGAGMLVLVPLAASRHHPAKMVLSQGVVSLSAVLLCLLLAGPLKLVSPAVAENAAATLPVLREVWSFGVVQLGGLVSANLAGWWLTATVARRDTTLVEMSFFTIASQLRNITSLAPGLLTEGSYAVMADPQGEQQRTPQRVMALCAFASTSATLLLAIPGMLLAPWFVAAVYGTGYRGATMAVAMGLAVAVTHMGNAPVLARLNIVSIRSAGLINTGWALLVAGSATLLLHSSNAALAMGVFFLAHAASAAVVLLVLHRKDHLPPGMVKLYCLGTLTISLQIVLAAWRSLQPSHVFLASALMLAVLALAAFGLLQMGKRYDWLPTAAAVRVLRTALLRRLQGFAGVNTRRHPYGG